MPAKSILVIHGPNLNMLGLREPEHYGKATLASINQTLVDMAANAGVALETFQSNAEAELVTKIQSLATSKVDFVIINPAAFTHYSYAIRDAAEMVKAPLIEVHLSNPLSREEFRHTSVISGVANGTIGGFGPNSYVLALIALKALLS